MGSADAESASDKQQSTPVFWKRCWTLLHSLLDGWPLHCVPGDLALHEWLCVLVQEPSRLQGGRDPADYPMLHQPGPSQAACLPLPCSGTTIQAAATHAQHPTSSTPPKTESLGPPSPIKAPTGNGQGQADDLKGTIEASTQVSPTSILELAASTNSWVTGTGSQEGSLRLHESPEASEPGSLPVTPAGEESMAALFDLAVAERTPSGSSASSESDPLEAAAAVSAAADPLSAGDASGHSLHRRQPGTTARGSPRHLRSPAAAAHAASVRGPTMDPIGGGTVPHPAGTGNRAAPLPVSNHASRLPGTTERPAPPSFHLSDAQRNTDGASRATLDGKHPPSTPPPRQDPSRWSQTPSTAMQMPQEPEGDTGGGRLFGTPGRSQRGTWGVHPMQRRGPMVGSGSSPGAFGTVIAELQERLSQGHTSGTEAMRERDPRAESRGSPGGSGPVMGMPLLDHPSLPLPSASQAAGFDSPHGLQARNPYAAVLPSQGMPFQEPISAPESLRPSPMKASGFDSPCSLRAQELSASVSPSQSSHPQGPQADHHPLRPIQAAQQAPHPPHNADSLQNKAAAMTGSPMQPYAGILGQSVVVHASEGSAPSTPSRLQGSIKASPRWSLGRQASGVGIAGRLRSPPPAVMGARARSATRNMQQALRACAGRASSTRPKAAMGPAPSSETSQA